MESLISVLVPVYNAEKYLEKCLDSIINQTYKNLEIILVNDGSTDNSGEICDLYAIKDSRIKVIHKNNEGVVSARKVATETSTGHFIGCVDSDDWIELGMYEYMLQKMLEFDVKVVVGNLIFEYGSYSKTCSSRPEGCYYRSGRHGECSYRNMFIEKAGENIYPYNAGIVLKLFERETFLKYNSDIPDIAVGEDAACTYSCIPFEDKIYVTDIPFYHYNKANSQSATSKEDKVNDMKDIVSLYSYLEQVYRSHENKKELLSQLDEYFLCSLFSYFPQSINDRMIKYRLPNDVLLNVKQIAIYGAGIVGKSYIKQISLEKQAHIVTIVDKHKVGERLGYRVVEDVERLSEQDYDLLIIALQDKKMADEVMKELMNKYEVTEDKIFWIKPENIITSILME